MLNISYDADRPTDNFNDKLIKIKDYTNIDELNKGVTSYFSSELL